MAAELTQDAVLHFLQSRGGSVPNAELLLHFRPFLREHADRERNRELFKKFVNSVARVKQEDGVSFVVLQRRFRGHVHVVSAGVNRGSRVDSPGVSREDVFLSPPWTADKPRNKSTEMGPAQQGPITTPVLPAAGICLNNNSTAEPNLNLPQRKIQQAPAQGDFTGHSWHPEQPASTPQPLPALTQGYTGHPEGPARTQRETKTTLQNEASAKAAYVTLQEPRQSNVPPERVPAQVLSHPALQQDSFPRTSALQASPVCEAPISQSQAESKPQQQKTSAKPVQRDVSVVPSQLGQKQSSAPRRVRLRQSYRSAMSVDDDDDDDGDDEEEEEEVVSARQGEVPLEAAGVLDVKATMGLSGQVMSQFTPTFEGTTPQIQLQDPEARCGRSLEEHHVTSERGLWAPPPPQPQKVSPVRTIPHIHIQDLDPDCRRGSESAHLTPEQRFRTPSPARPQNIYGSSSSQKSRMRSGWSSCEELAHSGGSGGGSQIGTAQSGSSWQQSAEELTSGDTRGRPWHRSIGDLCDDEAETSDGSTSSPVIRLRPAVTRRLSSNLRNRMCLSMGADLDQLLQDEDKKALGGSEAARLHRLHLISSSLSLRHMSSSSLSSCSTPPRCHSLADLTDKDPKSGRKSLQSTIHQQEGPSRQYQVPLEEREHLWLVKSAAGAWPDIYSLFREDPSLLQRRDFISGFTVLHWIAKHGDHRVLNTLWYGVEKAGLTFDTDAQSSCGYTPLHIAAMHSRKNIIRLLVNKFQANVSLRDAAGRKAWFYLPRGAPPDVFQLLGAPPKAALGQTKVGQKWASPPTQPQPQKRHRRHHFSSASGERPLALAGGAKVKRSSSLAAFLKNKSLQKVKAHSEWAI